MRKIDSKTLGVTAEVNGNAWRLIQSLADAGPRDRVFTVNRTSGGKTVVQFGDGVHGARPTAGGTITVGYRSDGGAEGNITRVAIEQAVTDPTLDQALWVAIRNRTRAISLEFRERRQQPRRGV